MQAGSFSRRHPDLSESSELDRQRHRYHVRYKSYVPYQIGLDRGGEEAAEGALVAFVKRGVVAEEDVVVVENERMEEEVVGAEDMDTGNIED